MLHLHTTLLHILTLHSVFITTHAYDNSLGRTPPMGWNSWCTDSFCNLFGNDPCSEQEVQTTVLAMTTSPSHSGEESLFNLGYNYIALDDCWSTTQRDSNGMLQADAMKFPHGMKAVADFVHAHGMKFGLYVCLFVFLF